MGEASGYWHADGVTQQRGRVRTVLWLRDVLDARFVLLAILGFVGGCEKRWDQVLTESAGFDEQNIVLASKPTIVGPAGTALRAQKPLKVFGSAPDVCLVLRSGKPYKNRDEMDAEYVKSLQDAVLSATATTNDGRAYSFKDTNQAWTSYGTVSAGDELSACISSREADGLPVGAEVSVVEVSSSKPLQVLGIYWSSRKALDSESRHR
ncbi:MAG: hypothetical protein H0T88_11195 [Lysobacter sp.]|nr:hypothetical protein [Lysobacter sp.]